MVSDNRINSVEGDAQAIFETRALGFAVEERALLQDVSISFRKGEISGLVGHNGSGKSTLLKLLARQQRATAGKILFAGSDVAALGARDFARKVAYLPQDVTAAHGMTVRELVACGRYPWHGALGRFTEADRDKVEEALALTHIQPMAKRMVDTLSGGERQRAWIAMLVAQNSDCLLLDEPTSALDIAHQMEVLALVRRLSREKGLSVIIVLHDINMASRFCDRLFALKGGQLIAEGSPSTLMTRETLNDIYGVDMDVTRHPALEIPLAYVC
ncbi:ATP-binding cassette domain-containing protein [Allorhizobium taibaishanense]|uniref:Iron complex transport system ATP-binding protein n=1 Tax=Allorhizobium taibaishanense TaxID=887144 RepID=A0A1Q9A4Q7_9HYPH|nr:ATP-binding cassette domain-containing protein [Allorhizobium taibaishanense]MBB4006617.1 iron complex transport system ATP-binding protein [Allorhizobium taibaishanense]OLP49535.1 iron-hydroxamate transporter ATP-binding subunit [Allorhizobium taibaishanense]